MGAGSKTRADFDVVIGATIAASSVLNNTIRFQGSVGNIKIDGTVSTPEADYAEYFEWADGNQNNEDRRGFFVSLIGNKIVKSNIDPIGVVSSTPSFIGDDPQNRWNGTYLKDYWGKNIMEEFELFEISGKTIYYNVQYFTQTPNAVNVSGLTFSGNVQDLTNTGQIKSFPKMNPNFDPSVEYLTREERKEWSPIGLLGKLKVRTNEVITGNTIGVDIDGYAVNGTTYPVLKTIRPYHSPYGIVQVLFK